MEFCIQNNFAELWALQKTLRESPEYAGLDPQAAYLLELVLEEMVSNIIKYGYDDDAPHQIFVSVIFGESAVDLCLKDDGHPFDPLRQCAADTDAPLEERCIGGLGIHLVRRMAGNVSYRREDGFNILELRIVNREGGILKL